jgi:hypothetical protein
VIEYTWTVIKGLGSVVGLITGIFVVIDRMSRGEPTAIMRVSTSATSRYAELFVTNPDDSILLFRLSEHHAENAFSLTPNDDTLSVVRLVCSGELVVPIGPGQSISLYLDPPDRFGGKSPAESGRVCYEWKWAQPRRIQLPLGMSVYLSVGWKRREIEIKREDFLNAIGNVASP